MKRKVQYYPRLMSCIFFMFFANGYVYAWQFDEHSLIGRESFEIACSRIVKSYEIEQEQEQEQEHQKKNHDIKDYRVNIACEKGVEIVANSIAYRFIYSKLYGQASAIAGDHISNPDDFLNEDVQWKFASASSYGVLALRNSGHFYPLVIRNWRKYKKKSFSYLFETETGAALNEETAGLELYDLFEKMLYSHAFADHFLHDSFAAGHMGFNRPASTSSPSLTYHNHWNEKGRKISNGDHVWITYGDGSLMKDTLTPGDKFFDLVLFRKRERSASVCQKEVRKLLISQSPYSQKLSKYDVFCESYYHVLSAATSSVENLLHTFISGKRDEIAEIKIAGLVPKRVAKSGEVRSKYNPMVFGSLILQKLKFSSSSDSANTGIPETAIETGCVDCENLSEITRPVFKGFTVDYWWQSETDYLNLNRQEISDGLSAGGRHFFGGSVEYFLDMGVFTVPLRTQFGFSKGDYVDLGYIYPFTAHLPKIFSQDGLLSHEVVLGGVFNTARKTSISYASYRLNLELGQYYIRGQAGVRTPENLDRFKTNDRYLSIGVGYVLTAKK